MGFHLPDALQTSDDQSALDYLRRYYIELPEPRWAPDTPGRASMPGTAPGLALRT